MMDFKVDLLQWCTILVIFLSANKYATHTGQGINSESHQLAEELHKQIIRKYKKKRIVCSYFTDNIWWADLVDI